MWGETPYRALSEKLKVGNVLATMRLLGQMAELARAGRPKNSAARGALQTRRYHSFRYCDK